MHDHSDRIGYAECDDDVDGDGHVSAKAWWGEDVVPRIRWRIVTIAEGHRIPNGYGISHYEPGRDAAVAYPIPLNLIVGGLRSLWWHVQCPPWRFTEWRYSNIAKIKRESFADGFNAGLRER